MNRICTENPDLILIELNMVSDERGFFMESFNARAFEELTGLSPVFAQDNHSFSKKGVLRGLHYQVNRPQAKLVRVVSGEIFDVVVDLRKSSPDFGKWEGHILSAKNRKMLWVPEGFAHGFLVVSESADVLYKTTNNYHPEDERELKWDDPVIAIDWPLNGLKPILSKRDQYASLFDLIEYFP